MKIRMAFLVLGLIVGTLPAAAQSERVVGLVVSVGDGSARADAVQALLESMGTETLRADAPNNAQLRSMVTRFAREAADSRATFVYLDAPAVVFQGRMFVLPEGAILTKPTDLFTQGVPIQAFARSVKQAEQGGAVLLTVGKPAGDLPAQVSVSDRAPASVPGSGAVLVSSVEAFEPLLATMTSGTEPAEVDLSIILKKMVEQHGVTISDAPNTPILMRISKEPVRPPQPVELAAPQTDVQQPEALAAESSQDEPEAVPATESAENPELYEKTLVRAVKRSIQRRLREFGYYNGLVDGIFGAQTRTAIKAFQQSRSEEPTGFLSPRQRLDLVL